MKRTTTSRRNHGRRLAALGLTVALVAASCGSRTDTSESGNPGTDSAATTTVAGGGAGTFGTLASPCSDGDASGATDVGVTDTSIKIGVISDKNAGPVRVPTAGIEPSMQAFVEWCNDQGGINGRKLELKTYDAKLFSSLDAAKEACDDKLFALVGNGVVQDSPMAQPLVDCDLVSVSGYTATYPMSLSPINVSPVPNPGNKYATGAATYFATEHPDAIKKSAIFYPGIDASKAQGERAVQARESIGYEFVYTGTYPQIQGDWKTQVQTLKNKGVEYVTMVDTVNAAIGMLQAMSDADYHPEVIDLGQQYYDTTLAESGLADGVFVQTNTQPFENPSPAISEYVELLKKVDAETPATSLGVQAFSAGLLFATAAAELGSDLTRDALLDKLHGITKWDGGGLHPTENPGENKVNDCLLIMKVEGKAFVTDHPAGDSTDPNESFVCDPELVVEVKGDWGDVPTRK